MAASQIIFFVFMALCAVCLFYFLFKVTRYMRRHDDDFGWPSMPRNDKNDEAVRAEKRQS